ncbi:MAG TPA: NUDIX hydrolase [Patescibacteria group bacterium]|nr:NUDIX hydrolase [Patescibacteria group bacterium]
MILPPNSIIVAGPVIIEERDGKKMTLLNKHKKTAAKPDPKWQFCGGEMEDFDASLAETAKRECREEMGFAIEIEKLLDVLVQKRADGSLVILVHYLAKRLGEIKPSDDIEAYDWFPLDNLPTDLAPNVKPILEKVK